MYLGDRQAARRPPNVPRLELDVYSGPEWDDVMVPTGRRDAFYDSNHPYRCSCFPESSSRTIPSMIYDNLRCLHPQHNIQPGQRDVFAYPWTVQTYAPPTPTDFSRLETAVSMDNLTTKSAPAYTGGVPSDKVSLKPLPHSAPEAAAVDPRNRKRRLPPNTALLNPFHDLRQRYRRGSTRIHQEPDPKREVYPTTARYKQLTSSRYPRRDVFPPPSVGKVYARASMQSARSYPDGQPASFDKPVPCKYPLQRFHTSGFLKRPTNAQDRYHRLFHFERNGEATRLFHYADRPHLAVQRSPSTQRENQVPERIFDGHYLDPRSGRTYEYRVTYNKQNLQGDKRMVTA